MKRFILLLVTLCSFFMSQLAMADVALDAAAAAVVVEIATWYAATGFITIVGSALTIAAIVVAGFVWLKAAIFSST